MFSPAAHFGLHTPQNFRLRRLWKVDCLFYAALPAMPVLDFNWLHLISLDFNEFQWISTDFIGFQLISMVSVGFNGFQ